MSHSPLGKNQIPEGAKAIAGRYLIVDPPLEFYPIAKSTSQSTHPQAVVDTPLYKVAIPKEEL